MTACKLSATLPFWNLGSKKCKTYLPHSFWEKSNSHNRYTACKNRKRHMQFIFAIVLKIFVQQNTNNTINKCWCSCYDSHNPRPRIIFTVFWREQKSHSKCNSKKTNYSFNNGWKVEKMEIKKSHLQENPNYI